VFVSQRLTIAFVYLFSKLFSKLFVKYFPFDTIHSIEWKTEHGSVKANMRGSNMRIEVLQMGFVEVDQAALDRIEYAKANNLCVACLDKPPLPAHKGCCGGCYSATRRALNDGKTTEAERIAEGKLLPGGKRGRKPSNAVTKDVA
jgi:hypothetical protein